MEALSFCIKSQPSGESSNLVNINSGFPTVAKVSTQRKKLPYICGLRARIECEPLSEHSTHSDRVTNIGELLSLGASPCLRQPRNPLKTLRHCIIIT